MQTVNAFAPKRLSQRALLVILPLAILLFGVLSWMAYAFAQQREIDRAIETIAVDRAEVQADLEARIDEIERAERRAVALFERARQRSQAADQGRFESLFPARDDGTRRSAPDLWTGRDAGTASPIRGFGAFIPGTDTGPSRRANIMAAFDTLRAMSEGLPSFIDNAYFFSARGDLVIYAPDRDDELLFYREDAPADFSLADLEPAQISTPAANPEGELRCTGLQPIASDQTGRTWTTGCMTPVRIDGRHIGAFGSSILLDELIEEERATGAVEHVVITADGRLITHPRFTLQSQVETGDFLDLTSIDDPELQGLWQFLSTLDRPAYSGYLAETDQYVSVGRLRQPEWYVLSAIPADDVESAALAATWPLIVNSILALFLFGLFLVLFIHHQISLPMHRLVERANKVSEISARSPGAIESDNGNEIEQLHHSFDAMEKRIEAERESLVAEHVRLLELSQDEGQMGHFVIDLETRKFALSPWICDQFGLPRDATVDYDAVFGGFAEEERDRVRIAMDDAIARRAPFEFVAPVIDAKGGRRIASIRGAVAVEDESRYFGIARDITTTHEFQTALIEARDEASRAAEKRMNLLATVSHEIRTPMTGILGMLEHMKTETSARGRSHALRVIEDSADALMRVLDDVLDYTRFEHDGPDIQSSSFNTEDLIDRIGELFRPLARRKGLMLSTEDHCRCLIKGDPARIQQILANYLSNAIKFTDKGSVRLEARWAGDARDTIRFTVADTGPGIAPKEQHRLFEPFEQASNPKGGGGTGLGLTISRRLAEAMGGDVGLKSVPGEGSRFWLTLPAPPADDVDERRPDADHLALVIDPDAAARIAIEAHLSELGFVVEKGVPDDLPKLARQPDLCVIDADAMGPEVVLKAYDATVLVALVSDAAAEHLSTWREAGVTVIAKPASAADLRAAWEERSR